MKKFVIVNKMLVFGWMIILIGIVTLLTFPIFVILPKKLKQRINDKLEQFADWGTDYWDDLCDKAEKLI